MADERGLRTQMPADDGHANFEARPTVLIVETESSREFLALGNVVELSEALPIIPLAETPPPFAGAIVHRETSLPVIHLDALLGRSQTNDTKPGALAIVEIDGRQCALGVKRVIGLSAEADSGSIVDLRLRLLSLLAETGMAQTTTRRKETRTVEAGERYLLVELAGQTCGFALASVAHIHPNCRMLRAPKADGSLAVGVAAIGGRVLPVLDPATGLGLASELTSPQFLELNLRPGETFMVAVERVSGIVSFRRDVLSEPPEGRPISAVAQLGPKTVWILTPSLIAEDGTRGLDVV